MAAEPATTNTFSRDSLTRSTTALPIPILDDKLYLCIMFISLGIICQTVAVFGMISNIISVIIFIKQGFTDSINVSFVALAISDLCSLLCIIWSNLCFSPAVRDSDIPMVTYEAHLITGSWMHVLFTITTGWITAFINFERCVCVILPLKVKTIFTPRRHIIIIVTFFVVTMSCTSLAYISVGLGWRFFPERNKTLIGPVFYMDVYSRKLTDSVSYTFNGVLIPVSCFMSVIVLTSILVVKLKQKAIWRNSNSSVMSGTNKRSSTVGNVNTQDKKIAKMVVMMSVFFIACFIPTAGVSIAGYLEPELSYDGIHKHIFMVTLSVCFTVQTINSSISIFIYLTMSTKYRKTFLRLFKSCKLVNC